MTDVASLPKPAGGMDVLSVRKFEAGPPANMDPQYVADPDSAVATTKEEEWVTKKKTELTTKRQIETRVKRQVVLEDGKVVEDSGPIVTTNTTEDTEKQEHNQTEHRTSGDDPTREDWVAVQGPGGLVKQVNEKYVKSREETQELLETEDVQQLGDISDEGYLKAVQSGDNDVRNTLQIAKTNGEIARHTPRVLHHSTKSKKTIDTQDTQESSERLPDGRLVTESKTTTEHEVIDHTNVPDRDGTDARSVEEQTKQCSQHYKKTKEDNFTEYRVNGTKIGQKMRYQAETAEGERTGDPNDLEQLDSLSMRIRKMRLKSQDKLAIEGDRKDAITKRPLNFDQEEETRKVETSKWLEHHFGSESSTRSSKASLDDIDGEIPSTQNSFINVTMKSHGGSNPRITSPLDEKLFVKAKSPELITPESNSPTHNGYYHGISHWSNRETRGQKNQTVITPLKSPPTPEPIKTPIYSVPIKKNSIERKLEEPKYQSVPTNFTERPPTRTKLVNSSQFPSVADRASSPVNLHRPLTSASHSLGYIETNGYPSPPHRRKHKENGFAKQDYTRSWDRRQNKQYREPEPEPDYLDKSRTPSPIINEDIATIDIMPNKKLYQRTRFAADIPPPPKQPPPPPKPQKSKFGESLRKFVEKIRSASNERKNKKLIKNANGALSSRSPSPKESTYQQYNVIDSNIPTLGGRVGGRSGENEEPVAPPRGRSRPLVDSGTQTSVRQNEMERKSIQRYYLGEDPFAGSIYGREKEYDGVTPLRTNRKHRTNNLRRINGEDIHTSTLGRLSKSTSRLVSSSYSGVDDRGGVQTLPRKLREENKIKKPVYAQRSLGETTPTYWEQQTNKYNSKLSNNNNKQQNGGSLINVSIINRPKTNGYVLNGPAKPARTYKSSLLRSKSFNVQVGDDYKITEPYISNPQLHKLDESHEPLRSPGIISNLNRSSKDITDNGFKYPQSNLDTKRQLFLKGLLDKAPDLYKTIHGDDEVDNNRTRIYTSTPIKTYNSHTNGISHKINGKVLDYNNSVRSSSSNTDSGLTYKVNGHMTSPRVMTSPTDGNTTRSITRRGSDDDYSETVRISSKSDDPIRPSQTDTVKTFTKKIIPSKNGIETIESKETKTVTKSRYRGGDEYIDGKKYSRSSPNGVVIEVRNSRK